MLEQMLIQTVRSHAQSTALVYGQARMSYQEADAADAWQRIYAFFGQYLGGDRRGETHTLDGIA